MASPEFETGEDLLKPWEVARLFRVDAKTVSRWQQEGKLDAIRTPGGHRRFRKSEVMAYFARGDEDAQSATSEGC
jgi:excisionase family DNA binding protein